MTGHGKHGKTKSCFPTLPTALGNRYSRFPHSHRHDHDHEDKYLLKPAGYGIRILRATSDGSVDVLVTVNNGPPLLLRNTASQHNHWLGVRLIGRKSNIDAVGAKVVYQAGNLKRQVTKVGGGSYLSSHDPRLVLGLGQETKLDWIEVHWPQPSGKIERFAGLPIDRYITIIEGQATWK